MVKALHRAGIEVILDVVYNHTAEGNHLGPMLAFKGVDNASVLPARPRRPRASTWTSRARATASTRSHPTVLRLIMDSLRYFVIECHVDGFRFDLASALAREFYDVDRLSAFFDIDPPGPGALAGEADRRAVGRRPGRLPGRQLPGAVDGVERHLPRHDARLLARRRRERRRLRAALHRLERPLRSRTGGSRSRRSTSSPRTTASRSRPRLVQRQAQRGERRGQPRRHRRQPLAGTAASRARPTTPRSSRCASASSATSSRRCCSRRACRCCSAATRSAARSAATTTPGARTTSSRGSTGSSTAERGAARVHAAADRAAPRPSASSAAQRFLEGRERRARALPDVWWFRPDGRRMTRRDWRRGDAPRSASSSTATRSRRRRRDGEPVVDDSFLLLFNA